MGFVGAGSVKSVGLSGMMSVKVNGKDVLVARVGGEYFAVSNRCTHMACGLAEGMLEGENATCPCHGSVFSVKTGAVVKGPAKKPLTVFEVKLQGDQILVNV